MEALKEYNILACDCDGTLLQDNHMLSESLIHKLQKITDLGVIVSVATGRPIMGVDFICQLFKDDFPFITYNGAKIVKSLSKEVLYKKVLSKKSAKKIMEVAEQLKITYVVWSDDCLYCNRINDEFKAYEAISGVKGHPLTDKESLIDRGIEKILWYASPEIISLYHSKMNEILDDTNCEPSTSYFLEFFHEDASKGNALKFICNYYGIDINNVIAIGDSYNDLSMIEIAGLGVAMGNSVDDVKIKAKYVTTSNEDDGVGLVIDKYILNKGKE